MDLYRASLSIFFFYHKQGKKLFAFRFVSKNDADNKNRSKK